MPLKNSNLLKLGTKLGTKGSSILLLNTLLSIFLLSLTGKELIIGGYYIGVELPIKANIVYNLKVS